jgi:cardiolipin synthase (CMP-forming)
MAVLKLVPHILTLLRIAASPVLAWLVLRSRFPEALLLVLLAGITDWLDGFSARRLGVSGHIGLVLDPMADKIMLVTLFVVLAVVQLIPVWMLVLAMGRDLVIVTGAYLLRVFRGVRMFRPSMTGKISTFFQVVLVLLVLLQAAFPHALFYWLRNIALWLTAVFTAWSWYDYVRLGIRLAKRQAVSAG